ncbi:MAG: DNA polymerase IV [Balneolales bacterium]
MHGSFQKNNPGHYDVDTNVHRITLYSTVSAGQQHTSRKKRLYLHLDMNCFYAQVEQVSYRLFGLPVIVGGWRKKNGTPRGIVATSSYEARQLGIKTAMSAYEAVKICPYIIFLQVHYSKYQAISRQIRAILDRYSPDVEGYSMDEFFLDISFMIRRSEREITELCSKLKNEIYAKAGLICSVGVSYSKTYAKLASDIKKPDGLILVMNEEQAGEIIYPLSLKEVWGIGNRRFAKLQQSGIETIADALKRGSLPFEKLFGPYFGRMLFETATGKDKARVIEPVHTPDELTYMHTFSDWTKDPQRVKGELTRAVSQLCYRMRGYRCRSRVFGMYIRFQDAGWKGVNILFTTPGHTNLDSYILPCCYEAAMPVVIKFLGEGMAIRGVGINTVKMSYSLQQELFFREDEHGRKLYDGIDIINNRFGLESVRMASSLYAVEGKTHFFDR